MNDPLVQTSSIHCLSQTVRARELKLWENVHPPPHVTCQVSGVRCRVSGVRCQVSLVICHVPGVVCLYQTVKARDITFWEYDHFLPSPTCHMSYVMCQVSGVISKKKYMYIYVLPNSRFSRIWTALNLLSCLVVCRDAQIIQKRTNRSQSRPDHTRVD